jgi:hypothetical protein
MRIDDQDWPRIYGDFCKSVQPVSSDVMPADQRNDHAAIDLICATCDFVIVRLHDAPTAHH